MTEIYFDDLTPGRVFDLGSVVGARAEVVAAAAPRQRPVRVDVGEPHAGEYADYVVNRAASSVSAPR